MSIIYVSHSVYGKQNTLKAVIDKDCIPSEIVTLAQFVSSADFNKRADRSERFWHMYDKLKWMESLDFNICIDFGDYFYETGQTIEIKDHL